MPTSLSWNHSDPGLDRGGTLVSPPIAAIAAVASLSVLSLLGLAALRIDEERVQRLVPFLMSLAAGALLGGAVFDLIPEAAARHAAPVEIAGGVVAGFLGFGLLDVLIGRLTARRQSLAALSGGKPIVALNFIGDVLHNATDGALIAAAFLTNTAVGVVATLAIVLHEIPRELGSFGVFLHGGLPTRRAIVYNALTGVAALFGAAVTLALGTRVARGATWLLPIAAGNFLYVACWIIPALWQAAGSRATRATRLGWALAALLATAAAHWIG